MSTKQRRKTQRRKQKQSQESERHKLIALLKPGATPYNAARFDSTPIEALRRLYMSERQRFKARNFALSPYMVSSAPYLLIDSLADLVARHPPTIDLMCIDESHAFKRTPPALKRTTLDEPKRLVHDAEAHLTMANFVNALNFKKGDVDDKTYGIAKDLLKVEGVDRIEIDSTSDPQVIRVTSGESKCS